MGVKNLSKIIKEIYKPISIKEIKNKKIIVDTSYVLYKNTIALRNSGKDLSYKNTVTTHIYAIHNNLISLLRKNIIPIYIFDGEPPKIKGNTIEGRQNIKEEAQKYLDEIGIKEYHTENHSKMFKASTKFTKEQIKEVKRYLRYAGIKYYSCKGESDPICALLSRDENVYGVLSSDTDILTFGCRNLLKDFSVTKKINSIQLSNVLNYLNINMDQFIDLCIIIGNDYNKNIKRVGPKKGLQLIKKYQNIENILENTKFKFQEKTDYKNIRKYFKHETKFSEIPKPVQKKKNIEKFYKLLIIKYGFNKEKLQTVIKKFF